MPTPSGGVNRPPPNGSPRLHPQGACPDNHLATGIHARGDFHRHIQFSVVLSSTLRRRASSPSISHQRACGATGLNGNLEPSSKTVVAAVEGARGRWYQRRGRGHLRTMTYLPFLPNPAVLLGSARWRYQNIGRSVCASISPVIAASDVLKLTKIRPQQRSHVRSHPWLLRPGHLCQRLSLPVPVALGRVLCRWA